MNDTYNLWSPVVTTKLVLASGGPRGPHVSVGTQEAPSPCRNPCQCGHSSGTVLGGADHVWQAWESQGAHSALPPSSQPRLFALSKRQRFRHQGTWCLENLLLKDQELLLNSDLHSLSPASPL